MAIPPDTEGGLWLRTLGLRVAAEAASGPFMGPRLRLSTREGRRLLYLDEEAAALYAFATAAGRAIICYAHVTNQMAQSEGDFEKGEHAGSQTVLHVLGQTVRCWRQGQQARPTESTPGKEGS